MIISHEHRFVFLKTNKTAGTSIEIGLSRFCGPEDVITPIHGPDEAKRRALGYPGPQHHLATPLEYRPRDLAKLVLRGERKLRFYNHMPAAEVKSRLGDERWNEYFTFCFERNPWDRMVSLYYWYQGKQQRKVTVSEFLDMSGPGLLAKHGRGVYTIDGKIAVDTVFLYEDLAGALTEIRDKLGLSAPIEIPVTKAGHRPQGGSYRDVLGPADRDRIAELFAFEIEAFGYEF